MALLHHRLNQRPISAEETRLDDDLRARLGELLRPDMERLAPLMGPGFDGWGLLD